MAAHGRVRRSSTAGHVALGRSQSVGARSPMHVARRRQRTRAGRSAGSTGSDRRRSYARRDGQTALKSLDQPPRRDRPRAARPHRQPRRSRSWSSSTTTRSPPTRAAVDGLAATSPSVTGEELTGESAAERRYDGYVAEQEAAFVDELAAAVPGAKVGPALRTVYGGVAADVPANQVDDVLAHRRRRRRPDATSCTSR